MIGSGGPYPLLNFKIVISVLIRPLPVWSRLGSWTGQRWRWWRRRDAGTRISSTRMKICPGRYLVIDWSLFDHYLVILWEQRCYRWGWRYAQVGIWISYGNLLVAFIKQDFWTFCRQRLIASRGGRSKRLTIKINIFCLLCEFLGQESGLHNVNCIYIYILLFTFEYFQVRSAGIKMEDKRPDLQDHKIPKRWRQLVTSFSIIILKIFVSTLW